MKVEQANVRDFKKEVDYTSGGIVSKQILKTKGGNVTLFAFDEDQSLSDHTAAFDALVIIIEGEAEVTIDGKPYPLTEGNSIIFPANIPHGVKAVSSFKMLLTMLKEC